MLLTLTSLWQEQAGNVVIEGEGCAANAQIGSGEILISTGTVGGFIKRPRKPRRRGRRDYWTPHRMPVVVPVVNVRVMGQGVSARPRVGTGTFSIGVDLSEDELVAILMMAADETPVRRKMRIFQRAIESGYSPAEAPALLDQACDALAEHCAAN